MAEIQGAHLVGSIPVEEANEVFELVHRHLPQHLRRIPDGEIGEHDRWIAWQYPKLAQSPQLTANVVDTGYLGRELEQFELNDDATEIELVDLGYADAAIDSWQKFRAAKSRGVIDVHTRFMVGLPSPLSVVTMYVAPTARRMVLAAWTQSMEDQVERIIDAIPADELAIQWEVCIEFGMLEGIWTYLDTGLGGESAKPGIAESLVHLGNLIPEPVELGYHLCYGDAGHQHFTEPADTGHLAWAASTVLGHVTRPVQWIHLPVPRERHDDAYFAPLGDIVLPDHTELYLGLVHETGGVDGTRRRIEAAAAVVPRFGLATECGLGRRELATIGPLLAQHTALSNPIADIP